jgi:hypothetical protein
MWVGCWPLPRSRLKFKLGCIDHEFLLSVPPCKRKKFWKNYIFAEESQIAAIRRYRGSALSSYFKTIGSFLELNNNIVVFKIIAIKIG